MKINLFVEGKLRLKDKTWNSLKVRVVPNDYYTCIYILICASFKIFIRYWIYAERTTRNKDTKTATTRSCL